MIELVSARDHISSLDSRAEIVALPGVGRDGVRFRAFNTEALLTITKPDSERLCGCVIFAEVQDLRLNLASVNEMNRRINFGSVRFYEPDVAIVSSGALYDPSQPISELDTLLTAWSDTVDQFWSYVQTLPN